MTKRTGTGLLAVCILLMLLPQRVSAAAATALTESGFQDVPKNAYYLSAVSWAVEHQITTGTSTATFSPEKSCTRAQIVTFLWRMAGTPNPETASHPFTDVPSNSYYETALLWAVERGIANGTTAATFSPEDVCTRGQAVAFLWRMEGKPILTKGHQPFCDVPSGSFYEEAVRWALNKGVTKGTSATTFQPDSDCTRAQIVTFLHNWRPGNDSLHILMYHQVIQGREEDCDVWTTTSECFRRDMQWLIDSGYSFYLPGEVADGAFLAKKSVMVTFDDGYVSGYTLVMPILRELGAKAVVAVIVRRQEENWPTALTWDMCREMVASGLVEIGSHTYDCHEEGVRRQPGENQAAYEGRVLADLQTSVDLLKQNLGRKVRFFSYPGGGTDPWADDYLRTNFDMTVTTQFGCADLSGGRYMLTRYNINAAVSPARYLPE